MSSIVLIPQQMKEEREEKLIEGRIKTES